MVTVADIMSTDVLAIQEITTACEAIETLVERGFSAAPVVRGDTLVGFVSDLELFDVLFVPSLRHRPISELMVEEVVTVDETTPLDRVAHLSALHDISRIPVVRESTLVGIVSRHDLLRYAARNEQPLVDPLSRLMSDLADDGIV